MMHPSITCQLQFPGSIFGFSFTKDFIVAPAETAVVHSLKCQQCERNKGQNCSNHHTVFKVGLIWDAQCHPTSNLMLTASAMKEAPGRMGLWNLENGTHIRDFVRDTTYIKRVLFLDLDSTFASGCDDGVITLWNRATEKPTGSLQGHTGAIARMIRHANLLISGSLDNTARLWDFAKGTCVRVLEGHPSYVSILQLSPDHSLLRTGSGRNGELRIWNWADGQLVAACQAETRATSQLSDIDGDLMTCGIDGVVRTWTQEGGLIKTFSAHEAPIRGLAKIGKFVVTAGSKDGRVKVWDWEQEVYLFDLQDPVHMVSLIITADEKVAVWSWDLNDFHYIKVWDLAEIQKEAMKRV